MEPVNRKNTYRLVTSHCFLVSIISLDTSCSNGIRLIKEHEKEKTAFSYLLKWQKTLPSRQTITQMFQRSIKIQQDQSRRLERETHRRR